MELADNWKAIQASMQRAFETRPDLFQPVLEAKNLDPQYAHDLAHVKRFLEWWVTDDQFREMVEIKSQALLEERGIDTDPEEIRYLWDHSFCRNAGATPGWKPPIRTQQYQMMMFEKLLHREKLRMIDGVPDDARLAAWRERQVRRTLGHLGQASYAGIVHAPFAIELSDGCSVGCWFCGVSAQKRKQDFLYTEANARLWQDSLQVLRDVVGPAAQCGFCYWATDPLDNPDYEKFCLDFARICGRFPQTTTAQAQKHVDRVRKLLKLSREHRCMINRFSILSRSQFKAVMSAFTPEELLYTEIVTQNLEALFMQSNAGRARGSKRLQKKAEFNRLQPGTWENNPGTIACVSGFLINMVHKRAQLITPAPSSDRWPDGYWIFEEGHFTDSTGLRDLLEGMIARHMPTALRASTPVRFRPDLEFSPTEQGFTLKAFGGANTYNFNPGFYKIGPAIVASQDRTAGEIVIDLEDNDGLLAEQSMDILNYLFEEGMLDEEPSYSISDQSMSPRGVRPLETNPVLAPT
jgi:radical SAM family RiPP maturation amino acid epimerase